MPRGLVMDADLDTLATALYVKIDQLVLDAPHRAPWRPRVGIAPRISDAELLTLCVMQALLRPARQGEPTSLAQRFFKPLRQTIESIFDTGKGQLDLGRHGVRSGEATSSSSILT